MIQKDFESITTEDIKALVANAVSEDRTLEYKEQLPGRSDEETREFLADVSSFANAGGGDLIYGIREQRDGNGRPTGTPESPEGLSGANADAEKGRLESMLRDGIDPRIPAVRFRHFDGFPAGPIIICRIPKSWASPHMVKFKNLSRFHSRTSRGKYQLDVRELRASFLASESLSDRISAFRLGRVGKILAGEAPLSLEPSPKLVLHLLPIRGFSEPTAVDLQAAHSEWLQGNIRPVPMGRPNQWGPAEFNFDGLLFAGSSGTSPVGYIQLFRNGAMEAVCARIARDTIIFGVTFEQELMRALKPYIEFQKLLGFGPPLFIALTLISVGKFMILPAEPGPFDTWGFAKPIDRDVLLASEVLVEEDQGDFGHGLRPALDSIWQASGWPGSQGYDNSGKWVGYARRT
jgi:hypothetical protein